MKLSPSSLSVFTSCPRCFWLDKNKNIKRPRGIFPSLPSAIDKILKNEFDFIRSSGNNAFTEDLRLFDDPKMLNKMRNWRTTPLETEIGDNILFGAIDDLLVDAEDFYCPLDYKTKGSAPEAGYGEKYYQLQLDCYELMLKRNGYKTKGKGYLDFYYPIKKEGDFIEFGEKLFEIKTNPENAKNVFNDAVNCLAGSIPDQSPDCEYCNMVLQIKRGGI